MSEDRYKIIIEVLNNMHEDIRQNRVLLERIAGLFVQKDEEVREVVEKVIVKKGKLGKVKHKVSDKPCRTCGKLISWDGYDKETRPYPLHVDENGYEIDSCYQGGQ